MSSAKRLQCSGTKPQCHRCLQHGYDCHYGPLRSRKQVPMTTRPSAQRPKQPQSALEKNEQPILIRSRQSTGSAAATLALAAENLHAVCRQLSLNAAFAEYMLTDVANAIEYLHLGETLYPKTLPLNTDALSYLHLLQPSSIVNSSANTVGIRAQDRLIRSLHGPGEFSVTSASGSGTGKNQQADDSGQAKLCDRRLLQLNIGYWTHQPIDNELAARAISCYLTLSHPFFSFFEANLFLDDLVGNRLHYCSPFLVNSLMAYACVSRLLRSLAN